MKLFQSLLLLLLIASTASAQINSEYKRRAVLAVNPLLGPSLLADGTISTEDRRVIGNGYSLGGEDLTPPTILTFNPADESTSVSINSNLLITFDENIQIVTGNFEIHQCSDDALVEQIDVTGMQVTVNGAKFSVNPAMAFAYATCLYGLLDSTAVVDLNSNPFPGISDETVWNFTTSAMPISGNIFNPLISRRRR